MDVRLVPGSNLDENRIRCSEFSAIIVKVPGHFFTLIEVGGLDACRLHPPITICGVSQARAPRNPLLTESRAPSSNPSMAPPFFYPTGTPARPDNRHGRKVNKVEKGNSPNPAESLNKTNATVPWQETAPKHLWQWRLLPPRKKRTSPRSTNCRLKAAQG